MAYLYMPMEIAARELDSRLLIALFAVQHGLEVIAGQKWLLQKNARWMPKGLWIFKTLTPGDAKNMRRIAKLGHRIAAIDEEMPGIGDGNQRLRWVDKRSVESAEAIFCLGEKHVASMMREYSEHAEKLIITGNPRWDFLRPELRKIYAEDADRLKNKLGRILLINTNIGGLNSAKKSYEANIKGLVRDGRIDLRREEDRTFVNAGRAWEEANLAAIAPLARRLVEEFPDHTIVLRPHPTEKIETYEKLLRGEKRVKILREGPAAVWLLASELLIHTSCTTATEAFALDQPSICFQTSPSLMHNYFLSGDLSEIANSEDAVVNKAKEILGGAVDKDAKIKQSLVFNNFFAAQSGPLAAERIAHYAASALSARHVEGSPTWKPGLFFRRKWFPSKFQKRIFPLLSEEDLRSRLLILCSMIDGIPIPNVRKVGDGQFHIHP